MFMSVHKGEGGVKIVPNPVHIICECPLIGKKTIFEYHQLFRFLHVGTYSYSMQNLYLENLVSKK